MTVKPLRRQNVIQHQVAGQENRMRHQEVSRTSRHPQSSQEVQPQGAIPPTVPSSHRVPCRKLPPDTADPAALSPQLVKAWAAARKSAAPPPNPGLGVGKRRQTSKLQLQYALKKTNLKTRAASLVPQSYLGSTLTTGSISLCSARRTWLSDLGREYFLSRDRGWASALASSVSQVHPPPRGVKD